MRQVYFVPFGINVFGGSLVGEMVKDSPLQMVADWFGTIGLGLTVSVILNAVPVQVANVGVTVYSIFFATLVVLTSVCVKLL